MAGVQGSALAIAVSNAGGLGSLPCAMLSLDAMRAELAALRVGTSSRSTSTSSVTRLRYPMRSGKRPGAALRPYYEELASISAACPRVRPRAVSRDAADVLSEFKPPVVSFHFGLPAPDLLAASARDGARRCCRPRQRSTKRAGSRRTASTRSSRRELEAGGHRGMFLSDDLSDAGRHAGTGAADREAVAVPVIAAGGIADAAGVARGAGARRCWRADRHGLHALSGSDDQRGAPGGAQERRRRGTPRSPTSSPAGRPAASSIASCASSVR